MRDGGFIARLLGDAAVPPYLLEALAPDLVAEVELRAVVAAIVHDERAWLSRLTAPFSDFSWDDAWRFDLSRVDEANRALRAGIRGLKVVPKYGIIDAFRLADDLHQAGWWWQARALRAHAARAHEAHDRAAERRARA